MSLEKLRSGSKYICVLFFTFICAPYLFAQATQEEEPPDTLIVGIKPVIPFVIDNADSVYSGISVLFWEKVAEDLGLEYSYRQYQDVESLLNALATKEIDVGIGALTITDEREARVDFTHSYFSSGLGVAVRNERQGIFSQVLNIASWDFLKAAGGLCLVILIFGILVWLFERKKNDEMFGDGHVKGIGSSFWWSAVTMTTVGYGDKAPITTGGRFVAFIWMFTAIVVTSTLTAAITSALTVSSLSSKIESIEDLANVNVGTVVGSSSEEYLNREGVFASLYDSPEDALKSLLNQEVDAVIFDKPIMQYLVLQPNEYKDVQILPSRILQSTYGIALTENSPLRNDLNMAILRKLTSPEYRSIVQRYIGRLQNQGN